MNNNRLTGRDFVLGVQHLFAMFGATVLVPALTGLSVSATLLFAGLGTLLFHLITGRRVPAFLGSSFAFLGGYFAIKALCDAQGVSNFSAYAGVGVACAGMVYVILAILFKCFGANKVMRYFPPIVTGPIIISIGLTLSETAITNCTDNWIIALAAIITVIACNIWGKGMVKIVPILLGVIVSYLVAVCMSKVDFTPVAEAKWIGFPVAFNDTVFSLFKDGDASMIITSIITIVPIAIATIIEHIGDVSAISSTVGKNFIAEPGLHRTLLGDGLATSMAALFGAPANTTYGENTGVLALTKVYDPRVIRLAAIFAVILSLSPKFAAIIQVMPVATMGGISLILYGMISAVGVRNVVENHVDLSKSRNIIIAALILVLAIGIKFGTGDAQAIVFNIGQAAISLSGLAVSAIIGILLNAVLPGKDYVFETDDADKAKTGVDFKV